MTKTNIRTDKGFTIIELLLALVFFSFLLVFATASYIRINRSFVRGSNVKLVQEETRKVIDDISSTLKGAGSGNIFIIDQDDFTVCDPRSSTTVNFGVGGDVVPTAASYESNCRHRLCIGSTVYAWNQSIITPNADEHSWYEIVPNTWAAYDVRGGAGDPPDPFSVVRTTSDGATQGDCLENIEFLESTALVDSNRIIVQDIDIYLVNVTLANTYAVRVSLSTRDDDYTDNLDLFFSGIGQPADSPPSAAREYKSIRCQPASTSGEFCFVETLSTIVTIR